MSIVDQLSLEKKYKVDVITDINRMLVIADQEPITPDDFNTLYDLSTDDLRDAKMNIKEQLRVINPKLRRSKGSQNRL